MGAISLLSYPPEEVDKDKVDPNIVVIGFAVAGATGGAKAGAALGSGAAFIPPA